VWLHSWPVRLALRAVGIFLCQFERFGLGCSATFKGQMAPDSGVLRNAVLLHKAKLFGLLILEDWAIS
jgi:hypothetical protein